MKGEEKLTVSVCLSGLNKKVCENDCLELVLTYNDNAYYTATAI